MEVVETNTALARSHPQASAALMASGDRLLSTTQRLLETSRARQDVQAYEAVEDIKRCAAHMDAELKVRYVYTCTDKYCTCTTLANYTLFYTDPPYTLTRRHLNTRML